MFQYGRQSSYQQSEQFLKGLEMKDNSGWAPALSINH